MKSRILAGLTLAFLGLGASALEPAKGFGANAGSTGAPVSQKSTLQPPLFFDRTAGTIPLADVTEAAKLIAGSGTGAADDRFGRSVSISGTRLVVGAPTDDDSTTTDSGSVYVFHFNGTSWVQIQKINPPTPETNAAFGSAVAIDGDWLVVGSPFATSGDGAASGQTYTYNFTGATWALQQTLDPVNRSANDNFGASAAIEGTTLVVGSRTADTLQPASGAAYVFTRTGSVYSEQQRLVASDGLTADNFGVAVGLSGDSVIVGANFARISALDAAGAAYVFTRTGSVWSQQQKLVAPTAGELDEYGSDVDIEGNTAIVGHRNEDSAFANSGAARIYTRSGSTWTLHTTLTAADAANDDFFGITVALEGGFALVGAYTDDRTGLIDAGAAYLFERNQSNVWSQKDKYLASDANTNDQFGFEVALAPGFGLVGAPLDDNANGVDAGAAYVFNNGTPTTTSLQANQTSFAYGNTLNLDATVSPLSTGTVNFRNGTNVIGSDTLDGASQANLSLVPLVGTYAMNAQYLGNGTQLGSTSPTINVSVVKADTSLILNGSASSQVYASSVSFTATISDTAVGGLAPTGSIRFMNGIDVLAIVALTGNQAVLTRDDLPVGNYNVTAHYDGDANFNASMTSPVAYSVTQATVSINITSTPNPAARNSNQTFTATLVGGRPTGNVGLQALPLPSGAPISIGSPMIVNGVASVVFSGLPLGSYTIRAFYSGDGNHVGTVTDSAQPHVVTPAADLSIVKSNGISFINEGSQVTYTITVTNPPSGDPVTGAIINDNVNAAFFDDSAAETSWTCTPDANSDCSTPAGTGDISGLLVDLDPGSSVVITLVTRCRAEGNEFTVTNTATVAAPAGLTDPVLTNNSSTDADASGIFRDGFEDN